MTGACINDLGDCADDDPCTTDSCDPLTGACVNEDLGCTDDDPCTGNDACDTATGACGGEPVDCTDESVCTNDSCDPQTGQCINEDPGCTDDDPCTADDKCNPETGACAGVAIECADDDPCTTDTCDPETGACVNEDLGCTDDDACTAADSCDPATGLCAGQPVDCTDDDACTDDSCDPDTGDCVAEPVECSDDDPCTVEDKCQPGTGACLGQPNECEDDNSCTDDSCDPDTGACINHDPGCTDENPCTDDTCDPSTGDCIGVVTGCDDDNPCTTDSCDQFTGECVHFVDPCTDDDACTQVDQCNPETGECVGTPIECADDDLCTTDTCDPATGLCKSEDIGCTDDSLCTDGDTCDPATGDCLGQPIDCSDTDPCTTDSCDPSNGACLHEVPDCTDDNPCTKDDKCESETGACVGQIELCEDDNPCTQDACDPFTGACTNFDPGCDDGDACTTSDHCDENTGGCTGDLIDCADEDLCTTDSCDSASGQCSNVDPGCSDDDPCTTDDLCDSATGDCAGDPVDCTDDSACTADSCDPLTGDCINDDPGCSDDDLCTTDDTCDANTGACAGLPADCEDGQLCTEDSCDPSTGDCVNEDPGCSDGDKCTEGDTCDPNTGDCVGSDVDCDDSKECTADSCDPLTGACDNLPIPGCTEPCKAGEHTCDDGACVVGDPVCDGVDDCPDASDELDCPCPPGTIDACPGECAPQEDFGNGICDAEFNCPEWVEDGGDCDGACDLVINVVLGNSPENLSWDLLSGVTGAPLYSVKLGDYAPDATSDQIILNLKGGAYLLFITSGAGDGHHFTVVGGDGLTLVDLDVTAAPAIEEFEHLCDSCGGHECGDGTCLELTTLCNGFDDCADGSDEAGCTSITCDVDLVYYTGLTGGTANYTLLDAVQFPVAFAFAGSVPDDTVAIDTVALVDGDTFSLVLDQALAAGQGATMEVVGPTGAIFASLTLADSGPSTDISTFTIDCDAPPPCLEGQTTCTDLSCVDDALVCDGVDDCPSGSDEAGCPVYCDLDVYFDRGLTLDSSAALIFDLLADETVLEVFGADLEEDVLETTQEFVDGTLYRVVLTQSDADGLGALLTLTTPGGTVIFGDQLASFGPDEVSADFVLDCGAAPLSAMEPGPSDLIISELLQDPAPPIDDSIGEFVELYNPSFTTPYNLLGTALRDWDSDHHLIGEDLIVPPRKYVVLARGVGLVPADYVYSGFTLSNGSDEVVLEGGLGVIDEVWYDNGATFPDVTGASSQVDPMYLDPLSNDVGAYWCPSDTPITAENAGTPGTDNTPCPDTSVVYEQVQPIFLGACSPCHAGAGSGGHDIATDYQTGLTPSGICVGLTVAECTIELITDGYMPFGKGCSGDPLTDRGNPDCLSLAEQALIQAWIDQGFQGPPALPQ